MRFRLPLGRSLFFLCMFILSMIVLIPLRLGLDWLAMDDRGIAAREARGSVWNGALTEAQFGDSEMGDVDAGLGFFPLLIGRARLSVSRDAAEGDTLGEFHGAVSVSGADFGIDDMTARLPVAATFAPVPIAALNLEDLTAHFENGLCVEAEGTVQAEIATNLSGISLPAAATGAARCDEGALLLPLIGQSGMDQLNVRIDGNGAYTAELIVRPADDAMRDRLSAAGFQPAAGGYAMVANGTF